MRSLHKIRLQWGGDDPAARAIARLLPMWQALSPSTQDAKLPSQPYLRVIEHSCHECEIEKMKSYEDCDRMINAEKLCEILDISKATMYRRLKDDPNFPQPLRFSGGRTMRWRLSDVMEYIASLQEATLVTAGNGGAQ